MPAATTATDDLAQYEAKPAAEDDLSQYEAPASGASDAELTTQTNTAAKAGGAKSPGKSPAKLPTLSDAISGAAGGMKAAPVAPPFASIPQAIGAVGGGYAGSKVGEYTKKYLPPWAQPYAADAGALIAGAFGAGSAALGEDVTEAVGKTPGGARGIVRDVANKYMGKTLADAIMPEPVDLPSEGTGAPLPAAPTQDELLAQAVKEGRATKLPSRIPKSKNAPTIDPDTAATISKPGGGPTLSRTPAWKTATANMPPPPDIAAAAPTAAAPAVTPAATPVATVAAPAAPAPTSLDAAIEARTAARAANAAKVAESSKLDEAIAANRPTDTEQTLTRLVKKRIWTPDDFRDAVNALGRDGLRRPSEGQSAYQARVMGMIRSSRAAVGMADSGSGIVRPPAP